MSHVTVRDPEYLTNFGVVIGKIAVNEGIRPCCVDHTGEVVEGKR